MSGLAAWIAVAAGGAVGASARYGVGRLAAHAFGSSYPYATLIVNIVGSAAMGALVVALAHRASGVSEAMRAFLAVGVLGAFTTMSTFSLDVVTLWERKAHFAAATYAAASFVGAIGGLVLGLLVARCLVRGGA